VTQVTALKRRRRRQPRQWHDPGAEPLAGTALRWPQWEPLLAQGTRGPKSAGTPLLLVRSAA